MTDHTNTHEPTTVLPLGCLSSANTRSHHELSNLRPSSGLLLRSVPLRAVYVSGDEQSFERSRLRRQDGPRTACDVVSN
jgi:hypothetical protein